MFPLSVLEIRGGGKMQNWTGPCGYDRGFRSDSNCTGNQHFKDEYLLQNCNQKLKPEMK